MTADFDWHIAKNIPFMDLSLIERAAGWPEAFTPINLANLQFPQEWGDAENQQASPEWCALRGMILEAIEDGTLPTVEVVNYQGDSATNPGIERAAFRDFLAAQGIEPSEHIRAWLRPLGQAEDANQGEAASKRKTQAVRVESALKECERRAADAGESFDRSNMPGTKAEFLTLLHALDADFHSIKAATSLDRYLSATGCKWPLNASKQPSALHLYARLFPNARINIPGAVSPQRQKA